MEEIDNQHEYSESQTPHFFKIIFHDSLRSRKLVIPKSFARKYGRGLSLDNVYLKVPSGDLWEVGLHREEEGGDMSFLNGWQDFLEFYKIKFGYFLVFGYQGNSEFEVLIFNKTTSEIKYPCKSKNSEKHKFDVDPCLLPVKPEMEENYAEMLVGHNASKINKRKKNADCMEKGSIDYDCVNGELGTTPKRLRPNKTRENSEAIIKSTAFDSLNPYFRIIMQASYVNENCYLWLPGRFMMDHIGKKQCYMKLSLPSGRFWTMTCCSRMRNNCPEARIHLGWKSFVKDNNLVVGDVCFFELIDSAQVHFQVTIFRAAKDPSLSHCPVDLESRECIGRLISWKPPRHEGSSSSDIQCAATRNHNSKNPSFKIVMTKARMRRRNAPIQAEFSKHFKKASRSQFVILKVAGRLWRVKVCFYRRGCGREGIFSSGWINFVRENSLQVGDVCIFELIKREEMVLKVSIHKANT